MKRHDPNSVAIATEIQVANASGAFATVARMSTSSIPASVLKRRVEFVQAVVTICFGGNKAALGRRLGFTDGSFVGQWIRGERPITEATLIKIAELSEVKSAHLPPIPDGVPLLALEMSQARGTVNLPRLKWEDLMSADLTQPFELDVVDDALSPEIFRGCIAILDPARRPEPAWPVLVRANDGNFYLRDFEAGAGGKWRALARARGYAALDSEADGLEIIAAMQGYKRPAQTL